MSYVQVLVRTDTRPGTTDDDNAIDNVILALRNTFGDEKFLADWNPNIDNLVTARDMATRGGWLT